MNEPIVVEIALSKPAKIYPLWYLSETECHPIEWTLLSEEAFDAGTKLKPNPHPSEYKYYKYGTQFHTPGF